MTMRSTGDNFAVLRIQNTCEFVITMSSVYVPKQHSIRRKKRPRRFLRVKESKTEPTSVMPRPVRTASGKKLAPSSSTSVTTPSSLVKVTATPSSKAGLSGCEMCDYRLITLSDLASTLREVGKCNTCNCPLSLHKDLGCRRGLVSRVTIVCSNPAYDNEEHISNPYNGDAKTLKCPFCVGDAPNWEVWAGDLLSDGHASSCVSTKLLCTQPAAT